MRPGHLFGLMLQYVLYVLQCFDADGWVAGRTSGPKETSGPKFTILWGHVEEILLLNSFFPIVDTCRSCEDIAQQSCAMVPRWRFLATFLRPVFAASCEQHISDLHSKFALGPHLCQSMVDIQPAAAEIRRGKKDRR